ncbi:MAG: hypothetical protein H7A32_02140 [Deltaproteobacteria bacterium]|nr:hypothetical protein [Deltaproteobacteria bacterium]
MKMKSLKSKIALFLTTCLFLAIAGCGDDVPFTLNGNQDDSGSIVPRPGVSDGGEGGSGGDSQGGNGGSGDCMFYITGEGGVGGPDLFVQISSAADPQDPIHVTEGQPDKFTGPIGFKVDPNDSSKISLSNTNWPAGFIRFYGDPPADVRIVADKSFNASGTYTDGHIEFTIPELTISLVKPYSIDDPFDTGTEPIGPVTITTKPGIHVQGNHLELTSDGIPPDPNQGAPYPIKLVGGYVEEVLGEELKSYLQDVLLGGAMLVEITGYLDRLPEEACSGDGPPPPEEGEDPQDINVGPEEFNIIDTQNDIPIDKYQDMLALVGLREAFGQTVLDCKTPGAKGIDQRLVEIKNTLEDEDIIITKIEVFDDDDDGNIVHPLCPDEQEFNRGTIFAVEDEGATCEIINQFNKTTPCTLVPGAHISTKVIYTPKNFIEPPEGEPLIEDTGYIVFTYKVGVDGPEKQYEFPLKGLTAPTPKDYFSVRRQGDVAPADPIKFGVPQGDTDLTLDLELVSTSEDAWDVLDIKIQDDPDAKFKGPENWDPVLPEASEEEPKLITFKVSYNPGVMEGNHSANLVVTLRNKASPDIVVDLTVGLKGSIGIPDIGDEGYTYSALVQVVGGFIDHGLLTEPLWSGPFYVNGYEFPTVELEMKATKMGNRMVKVELVMPTAYNDFNNNDEFMSDFVDKLGKPDQVNIRKTGTIRMWNRQGSKDDQGNGLGAGTKETGNNPDCKQPEDLSKPFNNGCAHFYMAFFDEVGDTHSVEGIYDRDTGALIFPGKKGGEGVTLSIGNFYHAVLADLPGNGSINNDPDYRVRTYLKGVLFTGVFNQMTQTLMNLEEQPEEFVLIPDKRFTNGLLNINKVDDGECPDKYLNPDYWDVFKNPDSLTDEQILSGTPTFRCYMTEGGFLRGMPVSLRDNQPEKNQGIWYFDTTFGYVGMFPEGVNDPNVPSFMKGTTAHFALQIMIKAKKI